MAVHLYVGFVERTTDGFSVHFPDLPIGGAGPSVEEAYSSAVDAGALFATALVQEGRPLPPPTLVEDACPEQGADVVATVLVPIQGPGKAVRVNVTLDEGLLAAIDRVATNRSAFLSEAARERLNQIAS